MLPSKVVDEEDGEQYPDPLSIIYGNAITKLPSQHIISSIDIAKFWYYFYQKYDSVEGDDILLGRNGIPYVGMLKPGDKLYELEEEDLYDIDFKDQN
jgi:hypothetical protein